MPFRAVGVRGAHPLLTRLLDTPDLARAVRALDPRALNRLVRTCGLEDCGVVVALATTDQLVRVFDDDLWRSDAAGEEERFDAARFGLWLEVLADVDVALAARTLVEMDFDLLTAALTRHVLVLDPGSPGGRQRTRGSTSPTRTRPRASSRRSRTAWPRTSADTGSSRGAPVPGTPWSPFSPSSTRTTTASSRG